MINISLTDFVDFVVSSGAPKMTKVKEIKARGDYHPAFDFWKTLRDAIVDFHSHGITDKKHFDRMLESVTEDNRRAVYPSLIKNYKSFLGRKTIQSIPVKKETWQYSRLTVRINPELFLTINDERHLIKLYFKSEALSQPRIAIIQLLLQLAFDGKIQQPTKFCVLDLRRNKLYPTPSPNASLLPLLQGEAASFIAIWESLPDVG